MTVTIRNVTPDDRQEWSRLWDRYLAFYETTRGAEVHAATWARIMDPDTDMFSAFAVSKDGAIIGLVNYLFHASFWEERPVCYLNDLYVDPDVRGAGAGEKLIHFVKGHCDERAIAKLYWMTAEDNVVARGLYDKLAVKTPFVSYTM